MSNLTTLVCYCKNVAKTTVFCYNEASMEQLGIICKNKNIRLTHPRKAVCKALSTADRPLFLAEIIARCPDVDRSSIYRTLELFCAKGIISPIPTGFKKRYELAGPLHPHHHHFVCDDCHAISRIESPTLEKLIHHLGEKHNLTITRHTFELHGLCEKCTKKSND